MTDSEYKANNNSVLAASIMDVDIIGLDFKHSFIVDCMQYYNEYNDTASKYFTNADDKLFVFKTIIESCILMYYPPQHPDFQELSVYIKERSHDVFKDTYSFMAIDDLCFELDIWVAKVNVTVLDTISSTCRKLPTGDYATPLPYLWVVDNNSHPSHITISVVL